MPGFLQLARPLNCVMSAVGVVVGGLVAVGPGAWGAYATPLVYAGTAALASTAGGNALNDLFDRETDKVNHPERPLASGALSVQEATNFAVTAFVIAAALGALASPACLGIVLVNAAVMYGYEARVKLSLIHI